jgi:hypothetical protein
MFKKLLILVADVTVTGILTAMGWSKDQLEREKQEGVPEAGYQQPMPFIQCTY